MAGETSNEGSSLFRAVDRLLTYLPILTITAMFPLLIFVLAVYAVPQVSGWLQVLAVNALVFFSAGFVLLASLFLPKRRIARYRRKDGTYFIPMRRLQRYSAAVVGVYTLIILPAVFLAFAIGLPLVIASDPGTALQRLSERLTDFSFRNIYEMFDLFMTLPTAIVLLVFFPLFFPFVVRMVGKQIVGIASKAGIELTDASITVWKPAGTLTLPWAEVETVRTVALNGVDYVLFEGSEVVSRLKPHFHKRLPRELRVGEGLNGFVLAMDSYPVSARALTTVINEAFL